VHGLNVADFDFDLPPELIAQEPPPTRGDSRLLVLDCQTGSMSDRHFRDLPGLLSSGDLLVLNNTKVFPARLLGRRLPGGGAVECLLVRRLSVEGGAETWEALVHPGQRLKAGSRMEFAGPGVVIRGEVLGRHFHGRRTVRLWCDDAPLQQAVDTIGHVPLPPYIKRPDASADRDRYQTVYAAHRGAIAAPTAGLHFTPALLETLDERGVKRATVTLHIGYGTFQPIRVDNVEEHRMEAEEYEVSAETAGLLSKALREQRRIIAVGTTTARTLESLEVSASGEVKAGRGTTDLFIYPGHHFRLVSALVTNFHLPRSSLLMLVSAFAGRDKVLAAYRHAVAHAYRFYSYGDAMVIL
jgi:S-adenosylmethionine:tRNA ribosyltransferase-isomerase